MAKAKRQIAEVMPKIDVVIEVLDARLPVSSANPMLEKLRGQKPCIVSRFSTRVILPILK
jgi:ribosome biogenesis GTPase A